MSQLPVIVTGFIGPTVQGATTLTPQNKVAVADFGCTPNRIQIKAGDAITFVNNGPIAHTATASGGTNVPNAGPARSRALPTRSG